MLYVNFTHIYTFFIVNIENTISKYIPPLFEKHNWINNSLKNTIEVISCFFVNTLISENW